MRQPCADVASRESGMKSSLAGAFVQIKSVNIENGKAKVELLLPDWQGNEYETSAFVLYLWDEKDALVFQTCRRIDEEEPCVIQLLHPHLWEGAENPYLYRLELYVEKESGLALLDCRRVALRTFQEISGKGFYLNGKPFPLKCVRYSLVGVPGHRGEYASMLEERLDSLVKMGSNMLLFDSLEDLSEQEFICLQEHCDRLGLMVKTADQVTLDEAGIVCQGGSLFDENALPTDTYYQFKACWGKEPLVYISLKSFFRQPDGSYQVTVYSNRKRVVLLVNGAVFGFQQDGPEFIFQDIRIKGFPVCLAVEAEECSMSVVCYKI